MLAVIERIARRRACAIARTTSAPASACSPRRTCSPRADSAGGLLEVDANDNPLRSRLCPPLATLANGRIVLDGAVGLGIAPTDRELRELALPG